MNSVDLKADKWVDLTAHRLDNLKVNPSVGTTVKWMAELTVDTSVDMMAAPMDGLRVLQKAEMMAFHWAHQRVDQMEYRSAD